MRAIKCWAGTLVILMLSVCCSQPSKAADNLETAGDIGRVLIPAIAYGTTFYLHDSEGRDQFYWSLFTNLSVTTALKYSIDKQRPNGEEHSFPSGHTSMAFQGATFIHKRYGWQYAIPAYLGAAFVGYSRVETDNHYVEDVLAGAAIGAISSYYFTDRYEGMAVSPLVGKDFLGLCLSKRW